MIQQYEGAIYLTGRLYIRVVVIATRSCVIASDVIVLLVTWYNTYESAKCPTGVNVKASLAMLLLRDGALVSIRT